MPFSIVNTSLMMRIQRKIKPGLPGTKKWVARYGSDLVCVRYKYDPEQGKRFTTIEIIVEEKSWSLRRKKIPMNKLKKIILSMDI